MTAQRRLRPLPSLFVRDARARARHRPRHRHDARHHRGLPVRAHRRRRDLARDRRGLAPLLRGPEPRRARRPARAPRPQRRPQRAARRDRAATTSSPSSSPACGSPAPRASTAASSTSSSGRASPPGGVLQQWVQLHHIRRRELAAIIRTLRSVFPHVALFVGGAQGILVASAAPLVRLAARLADARRAPRAPRDARRRAARRSLRRARRLGGRARPLRRRVGRGRRRRRSLDRRQPLPRVRDPQGQRAQRRRVAARDDAHAARALPNAERAGAAPSAPSPLPSPRQTPTGRGPASSCLRLRPSWRPRCPACRPRRRPAPAPGSARA